MTKPENRMTVKRGGPQAPCGRDCPRRKGGCAADCDEWKEYEQKKREYHEQYLINEYYGKPVLFHYRHK